MTKVKLVITDGDKDIECGILVLDNTNFLKLDISGKKWINFFANNENKLGDYIKPSKKDNETSKNEFDSICLVCSGLYILYEPSALYKAVINRIPNFHHRFHQLLVLQFTIMQKV